MQLLITFLTVVLVLNCLVLILLVLIQLPKKEAGAGLAFGGGATDALFGAGSGNALTKLTKYASGTFLGLALFLGVLNSRAHRAGESDVRKALATSRPTTTAPAVPAKSTSPFQTLNLPSTNLATPTTNALTVTPTTNTTVTRTAPATTTNTTVTRTAPATTTNATAPK